MRKPPDYDAIELKAWRNNESEVQENFKKREENIVKRISTYLWRFGFHEEKVHKKIEEDRMFAAHFAKEPRRTKLHENAAADWLMETPHIVDFENLPSSGKNAYYINGDGKIVKGEKTSSKSLDFRWMTDETEFFAAHKYTRESGGTQDNQYSEMRTLLRLFQNGIVDTHRALIVIVDGPYYTARKMEELYGYVRLQAPKSYACHIEQVPSILAEYI